MVTDIIIHFTITVEAVFYEHPEVARSALAGVQIGNDSANIAVICIERVKSKKRKIYLQEELKVLAAENPMTDQIKQILFHKAKIFREKLSIWAKNRML